MFLEVLYGPIASGKSTYAHRRAKEGALIVNDDSLVMSLHGGDYKLYEVGLKPLYKGIQTAIISHAIIAGRSVVVDLPAMKRSTRNRLRLLALSLDVSSRLVVFRNGVFDGNADGIRRFVCDPRGLTCEQWKEVGNRHASLADPIGDAEHFTDYRQVSWGSVE